MGFSTSLYLKEIHKTRHIRVQSFVTPLALAEHNHTTRRIITLRKVAMSVDCSRPRDEHEWFLNDHAEHWPRYTPNPEPTVPTESH